MNISLIKCHGSFNDFIMIDEIERAYHFSESDRISLTQTLCDRQTGVGADGILFVMPHPEKDAEMRIFNADGSEATMCGNGLRCVVRLMWEKTDKTSMNIAVCGLNYPVWKEEDMGEGIIRTSVEIPAVSLEAKDVPIVCADKQLLEGKLVSLSKRLSFSGVNMSNSQLVTFVEAIDPTEFREVGYTANTDKEVFPQGINVNFCKLLSSHSLYVDTYERGVGPTASCGTGMCASTLVGHLLGKLQADGQWISVYTRGGLIYTLPTERNGRPVVRLSGNATYCFSGDAELTRTASGGWKYRGFNQAQSFETEEAAYIEYVEGIKRQLAATPLYLTH